MFKAIIVLNSERGDLTEGFRIIGPFLTDEALSAYGEKHLSPHTPFWNEASMEFIQPSGQDFADALRAVRA